MSSFQESYRRARNTVAGRAVAQQKSGSAEGISSRRESLRSARHDCGLRCSQMLSARSGDVAINVGIVGCGGIAAAHYIGGYQQAGTPIATVSGLHLRQRRVRAKGPAANGAPQPSRMTAAHEPSPAEGEGARSGHRNRRDPPARPIGATLAMGRTSHRWAVPQRRNRSRCRWLAWAVSGSSPSGAIH